MAKYLVEARYTPEGAKGIARDGGSGRREAVARMLESLGGSPVARGPHRTHRRTRLNAVDLGEQVAGRLQMDLSPHPLVSIIESGHRRSPPRETPTTK